MQQRAYFLSSLKTGLTSSENFYYSRLLLIVSAKFLYDCFSRLRIICSLPKCQLGLNNILFFLSKTAEVKLNGRVKQSKAKLKGFLDFLAFFNLPSTYSKNKSYRGWITTKLHHQHYYASVKVINNLTLKHPFSSVQ